MQLSAILLFAVCFQVGAASTYGQTVSFTGKDVPLKTVFASVKQQTGYGIFFDNDVATLQSSTHVTLDLKNVSLELFLRVCLKDQPLEYALEGKTIFIKKKEPIVTLAPTSASPGDPILQIKGRVTNDKGEPLVNANITVKRNGHGTVTDANGGFVLRNVNSDDVVSVTFIGYKTVSMPIKDRISLTVVMSATTNDLDKVVVQAYGTTSQRLATGNIGTVRAEDIEKQPVMNVMSILQGQVAGAVVTQTNGGAASAPIKIEVRGRNTIDAGFPSDPLYVIDGVPLTILDLTGNSTYGNGDQGVIQSGLISPVNGQSPFFSINPTDIESISVLKDADATAIYGSRASNGAILITTKKGKIGSARYNITAYSGYEKVTKYYKFLNTKQYLSMRKEALANDGLPVDIDNAPDLIAWDTTRYTDWEKYAWGGIGKTTDGQASLSGGDVKTSYRVSGGYHYQKDLVNKSGDNKRTSFSFNIDHTSANQRFKMTLVGSYSYSTADIIQFPSGTTIPPNAPSVYDKFGNLNFTGWNPLNNLYPFGSFLQPYTTATNFLNGNLTLHYEIIKGLTFKTSLGYNNIQTNQKLSYPISSQDPQYNPKGSVIFGSTSINNIIAEPQLEYNTYIKKGKLNILAGGSSQNNVTTAFNLQGYNFNNDLLLGSVSNAPTQSETYLQARYKYAAIFGRINYNWKDKYILNLNARRDGSSKFAPGKQFGNFGSVGGAWIISEEPFFRPIIKLISFTKIRASYGITGGDQIANYSYLTQWSFGRSYSTYNGYLPLNPLKHTDSVLQWQVNKKREVSINIGLLNDRITLESTWYLDRCNDQLVAFPTPSFTGFSSVTANSPANVENTGWEFVLNYRIIDKDIFKWNIKFNIGINRNKLLAYPNLNQSPYAGTLVINKSLNVIKLLHHTGVDPQTGLYTYEDKNHDNQITVDFSGKSADDRYLYDPTPKYDGGLTTSWVYKNFNLALFFYFRKQIGHNVFFSQDPAGDVENQPLDIYLNHWKRPGDIAKFAKFTTSASDPSYYNFQYSDGILTDASFVRLKNVSLTYSIPEKVGKKLNISNSQFYIRTENIFVLTKYKGADPEVQNFASPPLTKTFVLGFILNL